MTIDDVFGFFAIKATFYKILEWVSINTACNTEIKKVKTGKEEQEDEQQQETKREQQPIK